MFTFKRPARAPQDPAEVETVTVPGLPTLPRFTDGETPEVEAEPDIVWQEALSTAATLMASRDALVARTPKYLRSSEQPWLAEALAAAMQVQPTGDPVGIPSNGAPAAEWGAVAPAAPVEDLVLSAAEMRLPEIGDSIFDALAAETGFDPALSA